MRVYCQTVGIHLFDKTVWVGKEDVGNYGLGSRHRTFKWLHWYDCVDRVLLVTAAFCWFISVLCADGAFKITAQSNFSVTSPKIWNSLPPALHSWYFPLAPQDSLLLASLFIPLATFLLALQIRHLLTLCTFITFIFTARAYARAVLGVVILSVRPSVRLSHAWIVTKLNDALQIFLYHAKGQSLCYCDTNSGWWATLPSRWNLCSKWPTPFEKRRLRPISAHNVSTVGDSEKSSITTNIKSTTGFPTSHRWSAYVTPKCPKGWLKERFLSISQRLIVSSAVNFVRRSVV